MNPITSQYQYIDDSPPQFGNKISPQVVIEDIDCLVLAARILEETENQLCVLSLANQKFVGGDHLTGHGQEESIIHRTNLLSSLIQLDGVRKGTPANPHFYEFRDALGFSTNAQKVGFGEFTSLYSPSVEVYSLNDANKTDDFVRDTMFCINIISSAAYNLSYHENIDPDLYIAGTIFKILNQLRVAKLHEQRVLILGAFGCGAFNNDSRLIAEIYRSAVNELEFQGCFDAIYFAIKTPTLQKTNCAYENFTIEFNKCSPPTLIKTLLTSHTAIDLEEKNDQLSLMMEPYRSIYSEQELFFISSRMIHIELAFLNQSPKRSAPKIKFLEDILTALNASPEQASDIIFRKCNSVQCKALTPDKGIFKGTPYILAKKLSKLVHTMKHPQQYFRMEA